MRELQEPGNRLIPTTIQTLHPTIEQTEPTADASLDYAAVLLKHYGFELRGYTAQELVERWVKTYCVSWVRLGVIEALYQGRYKAISVEQILAVWARRGQPIHRFNYEFERLISRKLPQKLVACADERSHIGYDRQFATLQELAAAPPSTLALAQQEAIESNFHDSDSLERPLKTSPICVPNLDPPLVLANPNEFGVGQETKSSEILPTEALTQESIEPDNRAKEVQTGSNTQLTYEANWSRCEVSKQPIHQFMPPPDASGFYLKLKAVVRQQEEIPAKAVTPIPHEVEAQLPLSDSVHKS